MLRASYAQENVNPCADFADTVAREVREETGVVAELGAVYKLAAQSRQQTAKDATITLDARGLLDATWMTPGQMQAVVAAPDEPLEERVSPNN